MRQILFLDFAMATQAPATTKAWRVTGYDGFESLKFNEEPTPPVGDDEVLVKSV